MFTLIFSICIYHADINKKPIACNPMKEKFVTLKECESRASFINDKSPTYKKLWKGEKPINSQHTMPEPAKCVAQSK